MAEPLIEGTDYIKCELTEAAEREMIVTLEDFLRRRSKLALVVQHEDLKKSHGLREACKILFDEDDGVIAALKPVISNLSSPLPEEVKL